jgi:excinuclease ABC subunit C
MHDKDDKIVYVGKAISLKNRVRQYFRKNNKTKRIENMVSLIDHFEYIVTDNEAEALILECNLIKKNMPKFNVLLKDDKTYPYIKINVRADYPEVYITRRIINDGSINTLKSNRGEKVFKTIDADRISDNDCIYDLEPFFHYIKTIKI